MFPERHVRRRQKRQAKQLEATKRKRSYSEASASTDVPAAPEMVNDTDDNEVDENDDSRNCTVCLRYNSMLYMDFIQANEMLVVEQPWLTVMATFPEALHRRIYGVN